MNILFITPSFYPATYWGGPIYSMYGLCNALARVPGVKIRTLTTDSASPRRRDAVEVTDFPMRYPAGYDVFFCRRWCAKTFAPSLFFRLWPMIHWADVIHLSAVYSSPTIPTLLICRLLNKPVVWSPKGALQRWDGTSRLLLKSAWERLCNALIKPGQCTLHVTSEQEAAESTERIPNAAMRIIPHGVDIPEALPPKGPSKHGLRLLYIGRLNPQKGIERLLQALQMIDDVSVHLTICGAGDAAYSRTLHELAKRLDLEQRVSFRGHVNDREKTSVFMEADVCVVPSFKENFAMVVPEALAHGVPVIVSSGTPWAEVEARGCGIRVDNSPECLAEAITRIRAGPLREMGLRGRSWMKQEFRWEAIAARVFENYGELARA